VNDLNVKVGSQAAAVEESSGATEKMVRSLKTTSEMSVQKQASIHGLIENAAKGQESMKETITAVQGISQSVDGIASAIKIISGIAANTNLLSMNAAIEAAHAGDAGRGFAVVSDEIRRLSETTRENSRNVSTTLSSIIESISVTTKRTDDTGSLINGMSAEINGFAGTMTDLINTFSELSAGSTEITSSLESLRKLTGAVKKSYAEMLSMTNKLREAMNDLAQVSAQTETAAEEDKTAAEEEAAC
jgi:methyl-accepting chemotaxis protein